MANKRRPFAHADARSLLLLVFVAASSTIKGSLASPVASIFDEFGPTPRTYDAGGHLHLKHPIQPSKYDPLVDFPEIDYKTASAVHKAAAVKAAAKADLGPPIYYAPSPSPLLSYLGPSTPAPLIHHGGSESVYISESTIHHPVNDYLLLGPGPAGHGPTPAPGPLYPPHPPVPAIVSASPSPLPYHHAPPPPPPTPHPYRADGEAQIDVHSSPDGFSYQVVEDRGAGSYSHVSQTRDFTKKAPYGSTSRYHHKASSKHVSPSYDHHHQQPHYKSPPHHSHHQQQYDHYPSASHKKPVTYHSSSTSYHNNEPLETPYHHSPAPSASYLDPLPNPVYEDEDDYAPTGYPGSKYVAGNKPRTYVANGHYDGKHGNKGGSSVTTYHKKKPYQAGSGKYIPANHGVRSYSAN